MMYRISKTDDFERFFGVKQIEAVPNLHSLELYTRLRTSKNPSELRKEFTCIVNSTELAIIKAALPDFNKGLHNEISNTSSTGNYEQSTSVCFLR